MKLYLIFLYFCAAADVYARLVIRNRKDYLKSFQTEAISSNNPSEKDNKLGESTSVSATDDEDVYLDDAWPTAPPNLFKLKRNSVSISTQLSQSSTPSAPTRTSPQLSGVPTRITLTPIKSFKMWEIDDFTSSTEYYEDKEFRRIINVVPRLPDTESTAFNPLFWQPRVLTSTRPTQSVPIVYTVAPQETQTTETQINTTSHNSSSGHTLATSTPLTTPLTVSSVTSPNTTFNLLYYNDPKRKETNRKQHLQLLRWHYGITTRRTPRRPGDRVKLPQIIRRSSGIKCHKCGLTKDKTECSEHFSMADFQLYGEANPETCFSELGMCFKWFADVGDSFVARGCVDSAEHSQGSKTVSTTNSSESEKRDIEYNRFYAVQNALVTVLLKDNETVGCYSSPMQAETEFSAYTYLFLHYHVCVCGQELCNGVGHFQLSLAVLSCVVINGLKNYL